MLARKLGSLLLAVALIIFLAVPVLVVPVKAANDYNPWIDIAEVCTVNNSGSNYFAFNGSTTVTLSSGFSTIVGQIDMIWFCGNGAPSSVYLWRNSNPSARLKLSVQNIGGPYYRIYGNVGNYTLSDYKFDIDTGTTSYRSYEIKSCRIAESLATYPIDVSYAFNPYYDASVSEYAGSVSVNPAVDIKYGTSQNYFLEIYPENWKGYDYIDLLVTTTAASIGSIVVMHNDKVLPFEVTYLYSDSGSYVHSNDIYSSPMEPNLSVLIHIDVSTVSRTSSIVPEIRIEGWWNSGVGCGVQFSCIGYIATPNRTGVNYWFTKGTTFLSGLFDQLARRNEQFLTALLDPDNVDAEDYKEQSADQRGQIDSLNQSMNQVVKPDVGNIDMGVDSYVDPTASIYLTSSLSGLAGNSLVVSMMCIALTLALIGYILYGKK